MKLLTVILVVYVVAFSFLAIRNHELYQTFGWDLGFFDQLLWQASRGNLNFVSTIGDINLVGDHFQPILYLLAPLYWFWDDVRIILIAQTILVASAAIPLFLLAKIKLTPVIPRTPARQRGGTRNLYRFPTRFAESRRVGSGMTPFLIVIAYLLFHGTQFTLTNEFHQSAFIPLFLSWGFYFLESGDGVTLESPVNRRGAIGSRWILSLRSRMTLGIISLLLLLLVREETALLIMGIGLMYVVRAVIPRLSVMSLGLRLRSRSDSTRSNDLTRNLTKSFRTRSGIYIDPSSPAGMTRRVEESKTLKLGINLVVIGFVSFFFLVSWFIPRISSQGKYIHFGYGEFGSTPTDVMANSLKDPMRTLQLLVSPKEKLIQVRNALLSFGGLPLLSPTSLIPVAIHYAVRFIDTRNVHRWFDMNHYAAPLGPLLVFATIKALERMYGHSGASLRAIESRHVIPHPMRNLYRFLIKSGMTRKIMTLALVVGISGTNLLVRAPIFALTKSQLYFTPVWVKDANDLVASVPKNAAVAANNSLIPHLTHREKIYLLPDIRNADYIAVDLSDGPNKYAPWGYEKMREFVDGLMGNGEWKVEKKFGQSLLLKKV